MAQFFQQFEVLHVSGADLYHIYIFEKGQMGYVHDLSYDRESGLLLCFQQQLDTFVSHALESVR